VAERNVATAEAAVGSGALTAAVTNGHIVTKSDTTSPAAALLRDLVTRAALVQRLEDAGVDRNAAIHTAFPPNAVAPVPVGCNITIQAVSSHS
jgi:hypothetical protein